MAGVSSKSRPARTLWALILHEVTLSLLSKRQFDVARHVRQHITRKETPHSHPIVVEGLNTEQSCPSYPFLNFFSV